MLQCKIPDTPHPTHPSAVLFPNKNLLGSGSVLEAARSSRMKGKPCVKNGDATGSLTWNATVPVMMDKGLQGDIFAR